MRWRGYQAEIFNVGKFRRKVSTADTVQDASFFAAQNTSVRDKMAASVLENMLSWLEEVQFSLY